jgi:hypothetical protein
MHAARARRALLALAIAAAATGAAPKARAQASEQDRAQARELARDGFAALDAKDWAKAEDLFRRADALFHAPTLLVGMARAEAQLGKLVEAWNAYHRVITEGVPPGANATLVQAVDNAKKEIADVEAREGHVTLDVSGAPHPAVTVDGVAIDAAAFGRVLPLNPGEHLVHGTADGSLPVDTKFTVAEGGLTTLPVHFTPSAPQAPSVPASAPSGRRNHVPAFVAFGVGGAGLIVGAVGGGIAAGKHGDLKRSPCASGRCADPSSFNSTLGAYHSVATLSTVGFIVAGVGAAAGVTLWFVGPRVKEDAQVGVSFGVGSVGVIGRF